MNQNEQSQETNNNCKEKAKSKGTKRFWIPRILILIILSGVITFIIIWSEMIDKFYLMFIQWFMNHPVEGQFTLIFLLIVATILFIPGILLTVGTLSVFIGVQIGSCIALMLGRYVFRESLQQRKSKWKYFNAIDSAIHKNGIKMIFLLRLSPLIPFNVFNYVCGITTISLKDYIIGGFGMIPAIVLFVHIGTTINDLKNLSNGNIRKNGGVWYLVLLIIGTILALGVIIGIALIARKNLKQHIKQEEEKQKQALDQEQQEQQLQQNQQNNIDEEQISYKQQTEQQEQNFQLNNLKNQKDSQIQLSQQPQNCNENFTINGNNAFDQKPKTFDLNQNSMIEEECQIVLSPNNTYIQQIPTLNTKMAEPLSVKVISSFLDNKDTTNYQFNQIENQLISNRSQKDQQQQQYTQNLNQLIGDVEKVILNMESEELAQKQTQVEGEDDQQSKSGSSSDFQDKLPQIIQIVEN